MKKNLLTAALAIIGLAAFGQTPRLSLYEEFTGETCPPCASTNPGLNALLAQPTNTAKCVAIKWQVPIPSAPTKTWSLYQTNKTEINWRYINYGYGINSAPSGRMDGQNVTAFGASSDHPANLSSGIIATAQSYTSAFNITMNRAWSPGCTAVNLTITIQATANFNTTGTLVFRTVMVERLIQFSVQPGTNGETTFEDAAIKSFPTLQNGVSLPSNWTNGQTQTFTLSCAVPSYTRKKSQIAFVGFIQDDVSRKVAQAVRTNTDVVPTDALAAIGASVSLTCNNAITPTVSVRNDGPNAITSLTFTPYTDGTPGAVTNWAGNLAPGASTVLILAGVTTATTVGSHLFTFDVTMSSPLYNLTTNNNSATYLVATSYQGSPVAEGFVSLAYPPTGWTRINNDAGPSWSRVTGSGGYNLSTECTKYDFFTNNVIGDKDELFLPPIDLSGANSPVMSMDIAYAQRNANSNDKLEVFASDNCGQTWTSVFMQSGASLATYGPVTNAYTPDPMDLTHWKTELATLTNFNKPNVLVKIVATSGNGNNLYLDNINLAQSGAPDGIANNSGSLVNMVVYPNPTGSIANVKVESAVNGSAKISVVNTLGQVVYLKEVSLHPGATTVRIDVKDLATGIYSVVVDTEQGQLVKKLTVSK